jgi:DNA-binding IclR family transcriptional regulator
MAGGVSEPGRSVTSRAFAVLEAFDERHVRLSLSQISRRAGLSLTTTHRLVAQLVEAQALERDGDARLTVGRRLWEIGLLAPVNQDIREVALPFLQDVHAATRETVHIGVRQGSSVLYVERVVGRASVKVVSRMGTKLPLHATGVGKVLLAWAPEQIVDEVIGNLKPVTSKTIVEPERLRHELAEVRRLGYARTDEEMSVGMSSVAVPIRTAGEVASSLGVVVPHTRRDILRLVPVLQVAAGAIGRLLG